MKTRNEYPVSLILNGKFILSAVIDQHYKIKHPEMNDELILKLIQKLNGLKLSPEENKDRFYYFKYEPIFYEAKPYRIVFLLEKNEHYIGVINAFRVRNQR